MPRRGVKLFIQENFSRAGLPSQAQLSARFSSAQVRFRGWHEAAHLGWSITDGAQHRQPWSRSKKLGRNRDVILDEHTGRLRLSQRSGEARRSRLDMIGGVSRRQHAGPDPEFLGNEQEDPPSARSALPSHKARAPTPRHQSNDHNGNSTTTPTRKQRGARLKEKGKNESSRPDERKTDNLTDTGPKGTRRHLEHRHPIFSILLAKNKDAALCAGYFLQLAWGWWVVGEDHLANHMWSSRSLSSLRTPKRPNAPS